MPVPLQAGALYRLQNNAFWPSLTRRQPIPATLQSAKATPGHASAVGLGIIKALCGTLTDGWLLGMAFDSQAQRWSLRVASSSTPGIYHNLGGDPTTWWIEAQGYLQAIAWLVDALTVMRNDVMSLEVRQRWRAFLHQLTSELGTAPPYTPQQLLQAASPTRGRLLSPCTESIMAVSDALYFYAKERHAGPLLTRVELQSDPTPLPLGQSAIALWLYHQRAGVGPGGPQLDEDPTPAAAAGSGVGEPDLISILRRTIRRGGTALITGPTGNGKSSAARRAAVAEGAHFVRVEGWPTLTDRELFGKVAHVVAPDGHAAYCWIDGPLAMAWRAAQAGMRVVLLIDELARFDPYYLAPLMGALDKIRGAELARSLGLEAHTADHLAPDEEYRVLDMPNGEHLAAKVRALSVVATSNLGADYLQSQQEFDAALLRRFEIHIDHHRLSGGERQRILTQRYGTPRAIADILVAAEDYSVWQTGAHNGLLRRDLNLGTCLNWAAETRDLHQAGLAWADALLTAAEHTAIPFICARDSAGFIEAPAADSFRDWLRQVIAAAALPA